MHPKDIEMYLCHEYVYVVFMNMGLISNRTQFKEYFIVYVKFMFYCSLWFIYLPFKNKLNKVGSNVLRL